MGEENKNSFLTVVMGWPLQRKLSLAAVALICVAVFSIIIFQARVADYTLLYANLVPSDASAVVNLLKEKKIPYRLEAGGQSVFVPADQVYELRLDMSGAGLPQGGGVGFEIFDKASFGMTDFAQKVNYRRALEGELARTVSSLNPVEGARVHLALPEKRLFKEQQQQASASVILKLVPGGRLKESQIQGIVHLVAGSVDGLEPENVTVVDAVGSVLSKPADDRAQGPMTPGMLDYQQIVERRLESRAQSMLDRALGAGSSLVKVTATLDFVQVEKTEELYDPTSPVVRSEQLSEEKSEGVGTGGVPGVQSNLDQPGSVATQSRDASSRSEETINYEVSRTVSKIVTPVGTVSKLSVAVLVADRLVQGEGGQSSYASRTTEELESMKNMVRSALGIDASRGDTLEVVSMVFESNFLDDPMLQPTDLSSYYEFLPYVKYALLSLGLLLLYWLLVRPMVKTMRGETLEATPMKTVEELEMEMSGQALPSPEDPLSRASQEILRGTASPTKVIKTWLKEG